MPADRFAAIRRRPAEQSSSYVEPDALLPAVTRGGVTEKAQFSAALPLLPALPAETTEMPAWEARADDLAVETGMPAEWAKGVAAIEQMDAPAGSDDDRWREIVTDARSFAIRWHGEAVRLGWQLHDVFGCEPDDRDREAGLVMWIYGGTVLIDADGAAVVSHGDQRSIYRPGRVPADTRPIWTIKRDWRARREMENGVTRDARDLNFQGVTGVTGVTRQKTAGFLLPGRGNKGNTHRTSFISHPAGGRTRALPGPALAARGSRFDG